MAHLESLVDLHASTTGHASSFSALAFSGTDPAAFALPSPAPSTFGLLLAHLGGSLLGETSFSLTQTRAASAAVVLRTATVYETSDGVNDRDQLVVAVQLPLTRLMPMQVLPRLQLLSQLPTCSCYQ